MHKQCFVPLQEWLGNLFGWAISFLPCTFLAHKRIVVLLIWVGQGTWPASTFLPDDLCHHAPQCPGPCQKLGSDSLRELWSFSSCLFVGAEPGEGGSSVCCCQMQTLGPIHSCHDPLWGVFAHLSKLGVKSAVDSEDVASLESHVWRHCWFNCWCKLPCLVVCDPKVLHGFLWKEWQRRQAGVTTNLAICNWNGCKIVSFRHQKSGTLDQICQDHLDEKLHVVWKSILGFSIMVNWCDPLIWCLTSHLALFLSKILKALSLGSNLRMIKLWVESFDLLLMEGVPDFVKSFNQFFAVSPTHNDSQLPP